MSESDVPNEPALPPADGGQTNAATPPPSVIPVIPAELRAPQEPNDKFDAWLAELAQREAVHQTVHPEADMSAWLKEQLAPSTLEAKPKTGSTSGQINDKEGLAVSDRMLGFLISRLYNQAMQIVVDDAYRTMTKSRWSKQNNEPLRRAIKEYLEPKNAKELDNLVALSRLSTEARTHIIETEILPDKAKETIEASARKIAGEMKSQRDTGPRHQFGR